LEPLLASGQPITTRSALLTLAKAAGASDHGTQLATILEWLDWVGLIAREGDTVTLRGSSTDEVNPDVDDMPEDLGDPVDDLEPETPGAATVSTDPEALVSFNMSVRLTAADVQNLSTEQMEFLKDFAEKLRG
jgi:hypothetical protein